jgi:hypothetical protein
MLYLLFHPIFPGVVRVTGEGRFGSVGDDELEGTRIFIALGNGSEGCRRQKKGDGEQWA